jgi:hypothetical protein
VLGSVSLLSLGSSCYAHRTADEELLDFPSRVGASADAGSGASSTDAGVHDTGVHDTGARDAGGASRCTGTDPISQFLCTLTAPTSGGSNTNGVSDLTGLLDSAGGLASIAAVLGAFTGTGGTATTAPTAQPSLIDLINLAGGLGNIATLLNGLQGGTGAQPAASSNPIADLIAAFAQTATATNGRPAMSNASPTLVDWLNGLGMSNTRATVATPMVAAPTSAQCAAAVDANTRFMCQLQAARSNSSLAQ